MNTQLLQAWGLFSAGLRVTPLGQGNINDTYTVQSDDAAWVLQRINTAVFADPAALDRNWVRVCRHLKGQSGYPFVIPEPVPSQNGATYVTDAGGDCWRLFDFVPNTYAPERVETAEEAAEVARAYGVFLSALRSFPANELTPVLPGFHDTLQRWMTFEKVLAADPAGRVKAVQPELERMFGAKPMIDRLDALKRSGALPLRVTHNDTKAGNVLLDKATRKAVAVIDLDTCMAGTVLSDYGDMVRTMAPSVYEDEVDLPQLHLRTDILQALTDAFVEETNVWLTDAERRHLAEGALWITAEQALRFLTDYLNGDTYYKTAYPEHNLVRTRNQLALLALLEKEL